jgi:hypothetical protein
MKSNPDLPGGLMTSKPTWSNALGCSTTSAFLFLRAAQTPQPLLYSNKTTFFLRRTQMELFALTVLPLAAAGYSFVYLLGGGGIFGAIVIFFIAKMLGK